MEALRQEALPVLQGRMPTALQYIVASAGKSARTTRSPS
jgi:hypothetical protein